MKNTHVDRRQFLKMLGVGLGVGATHGIIPNLLTSSAHAASFDGRVKYIVQIFLDGGCDWFTSHLKEGDSAFMNAYRAARPTVGQTLKNNSGVDIPRLQLNGSLYSLHPRLTELQSLYNTRGQLAIIQKFGVPQYNSGSHEVAQLHIKCGIPNGSFPNSDGWINRVAASNFAESANVLDIAGGTPATLGGAYKPLALRDLTNYGLATNVSGESGFRIGTAFTVLDQYVAGSLGQEQIKSWNQVESTVSSVNAAIRGTTFATPFPTTNLGRQLRDIYVAFKSLGTRIGYAEIGGFDLHGSIDPQNQNPATPMGMSARMKEINDAVAAFRINCEAGGIWQNLALLTTSEFGRTNKENGTQGCDHADASVAFLMGGAIKGGHYGDDPTPADLTRPQNSVDATTSSTDVYYELVRGANLSTAGLVQPGYTPKNLGLIAS